MRGSQKKVSAFLHFALCIVFILLCACGEAIYSTSETGSIAFSVEWKGAPQASSGRYSAAVDCDAAGVATVVAEVYDESGSIPYVWWSLALFCTYWNHTGCACRVRQNGRSFRKGHQRGCDLPG